MNNFVLYLIIVVFLIPFAPFIVWHFRYIRLCEKLINNITSKHQALWDILNKNGFAHTLVNYFSLNINKSNILVYTGTLTQVSSYAVGPYAQLRALKFIKSQNITDSELNPLVTDMEKTMEAVIFLTKIYVSAIVLFFLAGLGYIYSH